MNPYEEPTSTSHPAEEAAQKLDWKSVLLAVAIYLALSYILSLLLKSTPYFMAVLVMFSWIVPSVSGAAFLAWRTRNRRWWLEGLVYSLAPTFLFVVMRLFVVKIEIQLHFVFFMISAFFWQVCSTTLSLATIAFTRTLIKLANWE